MTNTQEQKKMSHYKTKEGELRNEFYLKTADFTDDNHHDVEPYCMQKIADYWLEKLHSLRQADEKAVREEITYLEIKRKQQAKNVIKNDPASQTIEINQCAGYLQALDDVLSALNKEK
jgi:hypothetical protein